MIHATPETPVGQLAAACPATIPVLEGAGIDYCCAGDRTLTDAARAAGTPVEHLIGEIRAALRDAPTRLEPDWRLAPLDLLVSHIIDAHHVRARALVDRACRQAHDLAGTAGVRHSSLPSLRDALDQLRADLLPHLDKEEQIMFPHVLGLERDGVRGPTAPLATPVRILIAEHHDTDDLLHRVRRIARDFQLEPDAVPGQRELYALLAELERDLHVHMHLEANVLFPRVLAMA
jgi:regulator of cell morphogenesis and NO signaling